MIPATGAALTCAAGPMAQMLIAEVKAGSAAECTVALASAE
ncbi:hypothetical protein GCM10022206_43430 [Streptomyces chiangmaiensis]